MVRHAWLACVTSAWAAQQLRGPERSEALSAVIIASEPAEPQELVQLNATALSAPENRSKTDLVDSMQDLVDKMQAHIHESLIPEQDYIDRLYGYFGACTDALANQRTAAAFQNETVGEARTAHLSCRAQQAKAYKDWSSCMSKFAAEAADCAAWPALQATKISDAGATCLQTPAGETFEVYLHRMKSYWEDELAKYLAMKARCASGEDPCQLEKAKLDQKSVECAAAQGGFERSFCDGAKQVNRAWHNYLQCYKIANETYSQASTASTKLLSSKRLDLHASHRIECLLKVFTTSHNATEALEKCKALDHSEAKARLKLSIKEAPPPLVLPLPPSLPGQSGFKQEEYSGVNASAMVHCELPFVLS